MKIILLTLLLSKSVAGKEVTNYLCPLNKETSIELSLLDKNTPSIRILSKKAKKQESLGQCLYQTLEAGIHDSRAHIQAAVWIFKLKSCDFDQKKFQAKIHLEDNGITFKQAQGKAPSYLRALKGAQPLLCIPAK